MQNHKDPNNTKISEKEAGQSGNETKQQQTDPQMTELKGLTDPDVPLEPKNNDNPFNE